MKHEKTFAAIAKLKDIEVELHRLKNALEMANRAIDAEREACAKVVDEMADQMVADMEPSTAVAWVRNRAAAIRARGQA